MESDLSTLSFWLKEKEAKDVVQLLGLFNMPHSPVAQPPALHKLGMVMLTCNPGSGGRDGMQETLSNTTSSTTVGVLRHTKERHEEI